MLLRFKRATAAGLLAVFLAAPSLSGATTDLSAVSGRPDAALTDDNHSISIANSNDRDRRLLEEKIERKLSEYAHSSKFVEVSYSLDGCRLTSLSRSIPMCEPSVAQPTFKTTENVIDLREFAPDISIEPAPGRNRNLIMFRLADELHEVADGAREMSLSGHGGGTAKLNSEAPNGAMVEFLDRWSVSSRTVFNECGVEVVQGPMEIMGITTAFGGEKILENLLEEYHIRYCQSGRAASDDS